MLVSNITALARVLGVVFLIGAIAVTARLSVAVLQKPYLWKSDLVLFGCIGAIGWAMIIVGTWFCSHEGGCPALERFSRMNVATFVGAGIVISIIAEEFPEWWIAKMNWMMR